MQSNRCDEVEKRYWGSGGGAGFGEGGGGGEGRGRGGEGGWGGVGGRGGDNGNKSVQVLQDLHRNKERTGYIFFHQHFCPLFKHCRNQSCHLLNGFYFSHYIT